MTGDVIGVQSVLHTTGIVIYSIQIQATDGFHSILEDKNALQFSSLCSVVVR